MCSLIRFVISSEAPRGCMAGESAVDPSAALVGLALLKVNADRGIGDYLDYLVPFFTYVLARSRPSPVSAFEAQHLVKAEFGLQIPQHATELVLRRLAKSGFLRAEHHAYFLAPTAAPVEDMEAQRAGASKNRNDVITALQEFTTA